MRLLDRRRVPSALSISRIFLGALLIAVYSPSSRILFTLSTCIVGVALITDMADGYLARRWGVASKAGYLLDGMGDKAFYVALLICIVRDFPDESLLGWALIVREIVLYALRVIDPNLERNLREQRRYSLIHAGFIRLYFMLHFIWIYRQLYSESSIPEFVHQSWPGWAACIFGLAGLFSTVINWNRDKHY